MEGSGGSPEVEGLEESEGSQEGYGRVRRESRRVVEGSGGSPEGWRGGLEGSGRYGGNPEGWREGRRQRRGEGGIPWQAGERGLVLS
jgi:hypothetical protein